MAEVGCGSHDVREENTKVWGGSPVIDPPSTSSKFLRKITGMKKSKTFRVAVLGQDGVGKTAFTVRFLTRRFIGDYDPTLEQIYHCKRVVRDTMVEFAVLDTAGPNTKDHLEDSIKWADAFVLLYSVADRCSFIECHRIKFIITNTKPGYLSSHHSSSAPVFLVGNQSDRIWDRMVTAKEGQSAAVGMGCNAFYEISVLASVEPAMDIVEELFATQMKTKALKQSRGLSLPRLDQSRSMSEADSDSKMCAMPRLKRREDMFSSN
ncbi:ras-related and estrogen-regulated growth inhibitor-like [Gigantopelta aegis]|uniref:ras-related and estrogen-regulated growth inhibitor-like n=1 Tax=Gigantopelta aegis TaxID=1735272 RepID=UPI001B8879AD|nr:ras-related and estrogen-regulated growth inhibitor-like [Gigantopelta aegis]